MSLIADIAQAVVGELNGAPPGTFALAFTAARSYRPEFDLAALKTLRVCVVPKAIAIASLGRSANQHDVAIDVAVQKKVDAGDTSALDGLMTLVEQIADYLRLRRLVSFPAACWVKTDNQPVYSMEHLEQHQVFTSVLTLTFRVMR
jgi:hypothetical protein